MKRQSAYGFSIGNYGYIGLGLNYETTTLLRDVWKFDPATNAWTQVADYGGTARTGQVAFTIGSFAYVGSGSDGYPSYRFRKDFWRYDPSNNTWTAVADFPGTARESMCGFAIGTKGYCGTGWNGGIFSDFWSTKLSMILGHNVLHSLVEREKQFLPSLFKTMDIWVQD